MSIRRSRTLMRHQYRSDDLFSVMGKEFSHSKFIECLRLLAHTIPIAG